MLRKVREAAALLRRNISDAHAHAQGRGVWQARLIKNAKDIPEISGKLTPGPVRSIKGAVVRMKDGDPMVFCTDGSLRHATGRKPGKAARKALKRQRRLARAA